MNARLDENSRQTLTGVLNSDGVSVVQVQASPVSHGLIVNDGTTGSDNGNNQGNAQLDENSRPTLLALASDGSGELVNVYANSSGALLIDSS